MVQFTTFTAALALFAIVNAQCGGGTPNSKVTQSGSNYVATTGSKVVYNGGSYLAAIQGALDSIGSGQRVAVIASGSIGANTITISSGKIFEGCGTINAANKAPRGAIESLGTSNVQIPYLTMTGNPYFGLRFYGTSGLRLGQITMNLNGGLGIRFDRDQAANSDVKMDVIKVTGAGSHAVETWNINGLTINQVIGRNVGECGLLLQATTNAAVNLVDCNNCGTDTGYAALRFANRNGRSGNGYPNNINIGKVVAVGGGRGVFCVSESGGATIKNVDIRGTKNNGILIENCYGVTIQGGTVSGSGEVRVSARSEFANTKDVSITATVNGPVLEQPCGVNIQWHLSGSGTRTLCS